MKWQIEWQGQSPLVVDLPSAVSRDSWVAVTIEGKQVHLQWNRTLNCYFLRDSSGLEQPVQIRSQTVSQFPGESQRSVVLELSGRGVELVDRIAGVASLHVPGSAFRKGSDSGAGSTVRSPMVGKIIKVLVQEGQNVSKGQELLVVEAMKMENKIVAPSAGVVADLKAVVGEQTAIGDRFCRIKVD